MITGGANLKKFVSAVLALALVTAVSVPALAYDGSGSLTGLGPGQSDISVSGKYEEGADAAPTYSVEITWANMNFVYKVEGANIWNPETHEYSQENVIVGWEGEGSVLVVNHSNVPVDIGFAFAPTQEMTGLTGNFTKDTFRLAEATPGSAQSEAPYNNSELTLSGGSLSAEQTESVQIGTITVSISAVSAEE